MAPALVKRYGKGTDSDATDANPLEASEDGTGRGTPLVAAPLSHGSNPNSNAAGRRREDDFNLVSFDAEYSNQGAVSDGSMVRRLTPTECERLQGLPDGWTQLGDTPDSRRYAALGDAVTATVGEWIGRRLLAAAGKEHE